MREKESQANGTALEGFSPLDSPVEPPKAAEKEEGSSGLGIPQFAVGALSLLLAGVFLVTSGPGGGGPAPTPVSTTVSIPPRPPPNLEHYSCQSDKRTPLGAC